MDKVVLIALAGLRAIAISIAVSLIVAVPIWLLWNAVVPQIFGVPSITFVQALCLNLLCDFLFKDQTSSSSSSKDK